MNIKVLKAQSKHNNKIQEPTHDSEIDKTANKIVVKI